TWPRPAAAVLLVASVQAPSEPAECPSPASWSPELSPAESCSPADSCEDAVSCAEGSSSPPTTIGSFPEVGLSLSWPPPQPASASTGTSSRPAALVDRIALPLQMAPGQE